MQNQSKQLQTVLLSEAAAAFAEEVTLKNRAKALVRGLDEILQDKTLPSTIRTQVESLRKALRKNWADLEDEAGQEKGSRKGQAAQKSSKEAATQDPNGLQEGDYFGGWVPMSITSFAALEQQQAAEELAEGLRGRVDQFSQMVRNIFWASDVEVPDKIQSVTELFQEFITIVNGLLTGGGSGETVSGGTTQHPTAQEEAGGVATVANSEAAAFNETGAPTITLVETDPPTSARAPLTLDVQIIRPGWGNTRDNHYYPAEMLKRCAEVFVGAKMYTSDHRQEEKSVKTEVSQIQSISGFTQEGAPIARVVVFDPDFAEQVRNRAQAGVLGSLECSILADGKARPGFEQGGRRGKMVEDITSVASVDWVTRAGAGGKALNIVENQTGGTDLNPKNKPEGQQEGTQPVQENAPAPVTIREQDQNAAETPAATPETPAAAAQEETPEDETPEGTPAATPETPAATNESAALDMTTVRETLAATRLPAGSVLELAFRTYATREDLQAAVSAEIQRIKEVSGSGQPFALGETASNQTPEIASSKKIAEAMDAVNKKYLGV